MYKTTTWFWFMDDFLIVSWVHGFRGKMLAIAWVYFFKMFVGAGTELMFKASCNIRKVALRTSHMKVLRRLRRTYVYAASHKTLLEFMKVGDLLRSFYFILPDMNCT